MEINACPNEDRVNTQSLCNKWLNPASQFLCLNLLFRPDFSRFQRNYNVESKRDSIRINDDSLDSCIFSLNLTNCSMMETRRQVENDPASQQC